MVVDEHEYALLVVGGGPAGMSAARAAADAGLRTVLVDERPTLGGQIFKQPGPGFRISDPRAMGRQWRFGRSLIEETLGSAVEIRLRTSVVSLEPDPDGGWSAALYTDGEPVRLLRVPRVVLAPGAHDRPIVFPGWTLPGVITAGGLQTLAKTQRMLPGERMVFAGSGPVALAFPAQLAGFGARHRCGIGGRSGAATGRRRSDRESRPRQRRRCSGTPRSTAPSCSGTGYRCGTPGSWSAPKGAAGSSGWCTPRWTRDWRVIPGTEEAISADVLCLGYGFVPSPELLRLVGCDFDDDESLGGPVVRRDEWCRTSVDGIYAAGDGTGVEGSYVAIDEGRTAGLAAAMDAGSVSTSWAEAVVAPARRRIRRRRALVAATSRMYRVGDGIYRLADDDTVVCRCEEVRAGTLAAAVTATADVSVVKAITRAGMGPCQGRNCQRHIASMISRRTGEGIGAVTVATPRMPVRPVPIGAVADHSVTDPGLFLAAGRSRWLSRPR